MPVALFLALRELRHDWIAAACFIAALVGVLAPMLILLALKTGAVDRTVDRLVDDPANRELVAVGAGAHDADFFRWLESRPEVGFVLPATRSINAMADAVAVELPTGAVQASARHGIERAVPLVVSGPGDPLIPGTAPDAGQVWLSTPLARALGANAGSAVRLVIGRRTEGSDQTARGRFTVAGLVPAERYGRPAIFLSLADMLAIERFRDDPAITPDRWLDPAAPPLSHASFRLYARTLADLAPLADALAEQGITVRPKAENAALLLRVREAADRLYMAIAVLAVAGFWAAMSANLRGMVERQRLALSLLRMLGLSPAGRAAIPLIQSLVLAVAGLCVSLAIVLPGLALINATLAGVGDGPVASLRAGQVAAAAALVGATAVTASGWAMAAVARIPGEEVLRHG
ncbi:ABC transporter [Cereibacter sphaeroides]|uniref:ABC transporter n=1 Tax=Cereibacter sphaeroides TaxID=1063 RepID=UPI001F35F749|nr:ABC transporter [Cereibacter sphaeroides]MCE6960163.1 ABC transporter [Cereibacter sphaeroides]MCE6967945.1 ABC transporter [Cereibacter sphaeroides]MCE6974774.1 ABC transporter [Cereibacter sphaeroides]